VRVNVKWRNVLALILGISILYQVIKMHSRMLIFLQCMGDMGPYNATEEKIMGMMAFGVTAILLGGLIVILIQNGRRD